MIVKTGFDAFRELLRGTAFQLVYPAQQVYDRVDGGYIGIRAEILRVILFYPSCF
jgi:hypothetical protein